MLQQLARPTNKLAMQLAAAGITAASPIDQIRKTPEMQKFAAAWSDALKKQGAMINSKMAALAGDQSALATKAQMVREDLDKTVKEASEPMANALTQMNTAQGALAQGDSEQAVQSEADAIAQLEKAAKLADQNSANSAPVQAAGTRQDQLEQLQKAVTDLAARETSSLQEGDAQKTGPTGAAAATEQQNLAAKAQEMQQAAAAQAPEAAPPLQQAVEALNNAGRAMKSGGTPAIAQTAQQNAVQALGNAAEQLGKEAAAAAQGQEQLAALERELQPIKRLIQEQQQVNLSTQKAIDQQRVSLGQAKGLARQEGTVKKDTEALRHVEGTATTVIAPALDKADAAMGDGVAKMDTEGLAQAQPSEGEALAALYKAQDMLADKIQKMAPELGMPLAPPQAVANAETQLGNAQKNVATAAEALTAGQNVNMAKAAGQMNQAAQRTAQADLQPQALPQAAREAIREAEQAAGAAAAAASAGQQEQAQTKTAQAQKALAAAQTALGQMQAGVGGLTPQAGAMLAANQAGQAGQQASQDQGQGQGPQSAQGSQPLANQANQASQQGTGAKEQSWTDQDGAVKRGLQGAHGPGQFLGLPERDRGALQQSQSEKYPQEYGAMIEEYMRGLANDSGGK